MVVADSHKSGGLERLGNKGEGVYLSTPDNRQVLGGKHGCFTVNVEWGKGWGEHTNVVEVIACAPIG